MKKTYLFIFSLLNIFVLKAQNNVLSFNIQQLNKDSCANYYRLAADEAMRNNSYLLYCQMKGKEAQIYYKNDEIEKSIPINQSLHDNFMALLTAKDPMLLYQICNYLGSDYNYANQKTLALEYLNKAKSINEKNGLKQGGIYMNLYQFYKEEDRLAQAYSAINTYQQLCLEQKDSSGLGVAYVSIGMLHSMLMDYEKAKKNYEHAYGIFKRNGLNNELYKPLMSIGNCEYKLKHFKEALMYYKQCYGMYQSPINLGICLVNIINTHVDLNELDSAEVYITKYEKTRKSLVKNSVDNEYKNALAGYYENKGDLKRALSLLKENKLYYEKTNSTMTLGGINQRLADLYMKLKQPTMAFQHLKSAYLLSDTLNKQKLKVLDSLTFNFVEGENKALRQAQENKILEQSNLIQKRTNAGLLGIIVLFIVVASGIYINQNLKRKKESAEQETIQNNEDFKTFRYTVSHDLKNSLFSAQQNLSKVVTFFEPKMEHEMTKTIQSVQKSLDNVTSFINRLRDFSASENQTIFESHFDCLTLVQEVLKQHQSSIDAKNIDIKIEELPQLHTDKVLFYNILDNIICNAIKFSNPDVTPSILIRYEELPNESALIITDNGIGIDNAVLDSVFKPFVRQQQNYEGVGLGLTIVKRLTTLLNMDIKIANNYMIGVNVKILLKTQHVHSKN